MTSWISDDFLPDPRRITRYAGGYFNPWLNIWVCVALVFLCAGLGAYTWFYLMNELVWNPSRHMPIAEVVVLIFVIGVEVLFTIGMIVVTIATARWWRRRARMFYERHRIVPQGRYQKWLARHNP